MADSCGDDRLMLAVIFPSGKLVECCFALLLLVIYYKWGVWAREFKKQLTAAVYSLDSVCVYVGMYVPPPSSTCPFKTKLKSSKVKMKIFYFFIYLFIL